MLKIKIFVVIAFALAVAAGAALLPAERARAQQSGGGAAAERDPVLAAIAGYKSWPQVQKPEKKTPEGVTVPDVLTAEFSAAGG